MGIMTSGVQQWFFQRISNAVFILFGLFLLKTLMFDELTFESLSALFASSVVQIFLFVVLLLACLNAILAGWQIAGDYAHKLGFPNLLWMIIAIIVSIAYFIYGCMILFC